MPRKKSSPVDRYEVAKGDWFSPAQRELAVIETWLRITREDIDSEKILALPDLTYFNRPFAIRHAKCEYDQRFHPDTELDCRKRREDRGNMHTIRQNIFNEVKDKRVLTFNYTVLGYVLGMQMGDTREDERTVPLMTSQLYGHRKTDLEGRPYISHKRTRVMQEILRRYKINVKPAKKLPPDSGYPQI